MVVHEIVRHNITLFALEFLTGPLVGEHAAVL